MEQNGYYDGPFLAYAKAFIVAKFKNHPFFFSEMLKQENFVSAVKIW